ncbi:Ig-like domain-containing protein [Pontibacter cellulosilyticus]|uniref:T9SS type A sorting domain-containing protein n=1 Tax=Pontibacter cellulosilyticus TaxID=1720253 RepID=A0A923N7W0_9BACT|nr:T9SS type A sorting domain-containing protein [Pontibacter cellulosilyticus]MBC5993402.1 T9SS type A sorting domain-containing protein [Pontibacter cellulosilyticus]
MKKNFTQLIAGAHLARYYEVSVVSLLLLFFMLLANVAMAQVVTSMTPTCTTVGQTNYKVTINGSGFIISTGNQVEARLNGDLLNTSLVERTSQNSISINIPDNYFSVQGSILVEVANRENGSYNWQNAGTVTVLQTPLQAPSTTSNSRCGAGSVQLSASGAPVGGSYRWYAVASGGSPISGATGATYTTPSLASTTTYYVSTVFGNCESSRSVVTATIITPPDLPAITNGSTCGPGSVTLYAHFGNGGNAILWYTSATGGSAFASGLTYETPILNQTVTYYVASYNTVTLCESARVPISATVYSVPSATVSASGTTTFCQGGEVTLTANATPAGGSYTYQWYNGTSKIDNATGSTYRATSSGNYNVVVTNTIGNCAGAPSTSMSVTVNPIPSTPILVGAAVCNQGAVTLSGTVGANGTEVRWYAAASGGSHLATGNSYTTPSLSSTTTYYAASYNTSTMCESVRVPVTATVNPLPSVSITTNLAAAYCTSDTKVPLTGSPSGGVFRILNSSGTEVVTSITELNPSVLAAGSYTVEYSYTDENSCTNKASKVVNIKQQPTVSLTGNSSICLNQSTTLSASGADSYVWSPATGLSATSGASVTANPTTTTTYTVVGTTNGCQSEPKTVTVTVNPLPDVTITPTGPTEFCDGNYVDLVTNFVSGYTYKWFNANDNSTVGTTSTFRAVDTGSYYVVITTDKGCALTSKTVSVIVAKLPNEATITAGTTTFCQGGTVQISANSAPSGQTYEYMWEFSPTNTEAGFTLIPEVPVTSNTYVANTSGYYRVKVKDVTEGNISDCFKTSQPIQVTVLPQPTADITSSPETQCQVASGYNVFTVTGTYSGGTGSWSATNGFTVTGTTQSTVNGITTSTATITGPASFSGTTSVTLLTTNGAPSCNAASESITLTVQPLIAGNNISGTSKYCQNATATALSSGTISGGNGSYTYKWEQSADNSTWGLASGTNNQASYTPSTLTGGIMYYRRIVNSGECTNISAAFAVTVTPSITTNSIAGTQNYCQGAEATALGGAVAGGTGAYSYQWQSSSSATGTFSDINGATDDKYMPSTATAGTVYYRRLITSGECSNNTSNVLGVTVTPAITANSISGTTTYCQGAIASALDGTVTGGITAKSYQWQQSPNGTDQWVNAGGTSTQSSYVPSTGTIGTMYYRRIVTSENCSSTSNALAVTVNSVIAGNQIAGTQIVCSGGAVAPLGQASGTSLSGGSTPYTYQWQSSSSEIGTYANVTGGTGANSASYTPPTTTVTTTTTIYYRRVVSGGGCSNASAAVAVTVTPVISNNTISGTQTICSGSIPTQLTGSAPAGGTGSYTYLWQQSTNNSTWTTAAGPNPNNLQNYQPGALTTTTYFRRVVSSGTCINLPSASITVTVNPNPVINSITLGNDSDSDGDGKFANVYSGQGIINLGSNPTGGTFRIDGVVKTSFDACALLGSAAEKTVTITYTLTSGSNPQCSTVLSKTVTIKRSTYRAVVTADPHPFCRGVQVTYTTTIYRDLEEGDIIYPYLVDANGQPIYSNGTAVPTGASSFPEPNMNYPFPGSDTPDPNDDTPQAVKNLAYRFFQPKVMKDLSAKIVSRDAATYQWGKNHDVERKNDLYFTTDAGLSSQDYYHVYVNLTQCGTVLPTIQSNRMYSAELPGYSATLAVAPNPICSNGSVTLTANLNNAFDWLKANTKVEFVLSRGDVLLGPAQDFVKDKYTYTLTTDAAAAGGFVDGDQVYLRFITDIERNQSVKKCANNNRSNNVTINVVVPQTLTGGGAYCEGGAGVPVGLANSQSGVSYQLLFGGNPVGSPVAGTGGAISFGNQTVAGTYSIRPTTASGSTCSVFGLITVYVTALPQLMTVSGGGEYCAGGTGKSIKLSSSQTGVSYQLQRTVNSLTSNVGSPISGTGGEITFPLQTLAGTYTVRATTVSGTNIASCPRDMTGNAVVTVNPLPMVAVNNPTTCETTPVLVSASVSSGTGPYTYSWQVPSTWRGSNGETNPGNVASFMTNVAGNYTVTVTDSKVCSSVSATSAVTVTPLTTLIDPLLIVTWNSSMTKWDVTIDRSKYSADAFGTNPEYIWSRRTTGDWIEVKRGKEDFYTEQNPSEKPEIQVEILNSVSCIRYFINNTDVKPFPVEIIYLNAQKQGNEVVLEWATAMERDNEGFEVQVSEDGQNYRKLDFVATKNGNSSQKQVYKYVDKENGKHGTRYYRLKQMDHSGQVEYFGPKAVEFGSVTNKIVVYPNPFVNKIEMNIDAEQDGEMEIVLSNSVGKQLIHKTIMVEKGVNSEQLILESNLPQGVYFVTTRMGSVTNHFKLLKQ